MNLLISSESAFRLAAIVVGLGLLTGCTNRVEIRVVDSITGESIANAKARLTRVDYRFPMHRETTELDPLSSDDDGKVVVKGIRRKHDFVTISAPNYCDASVGLLEDGKAGILSPFPPIGVNSTNIHLHQRVADTEPLLVVPLVPKPTSKSTNDQEEVFNTDHVSIVYDVAPEVERLLTR